MKQKTRILIFILVGAAVVVMGVLGMLAARGGGSDGAGKSIDLGQKYLVELSYDKAVIAFTEAIDIDPTNIDAYKGIAQAYEGIGDTEKAIEWLRKGYDLTGDSSLKAELDRINAYLQPAETTVTTAVTTTVTTTEATTTVTTEKMLTVPDLIGMSEADAVSACEMAEIPYAILTEESDSVEKGFVVSQRIPASAKVKEGVELVIVVSGGASVGTVTAITPAETAAETTAGTTTTAATMAETTTVTTITEPKPVTTVETTTAAATTAAPKEITNDELVEVLKQLIKDPNADIEQEKLDMITQISIIGDEYYAVNESCSEKYKFDSIYRNYEKTKIFAHQYGSECDKEIKYNKIADISFIKRLNYLEKIEFCVCKISDISPLSDMKKITKLEVKYCDVVNINTLSELTNIMYLDLTGNKISDINALIKLTSLTELNLGENKISDINALSNLENLEFLDLHSNQISIINALSKMKKIKVLFLFDNIITDISALSNLTNLETLWIAGNKFSEISVLSSLTNLKDLVLYRSEINMEDIIDLKIALPNCKICDGLSWEIL